MAEGRRSLADKGVAILPGFLTREALDAIVREGEELLPKAHREDVSGSPYLELPDASYPEGHPRRTSVHSAAWVIAYDFFPQDSSLRRLYEILSNVVDWAINHFIDRVALRGSADAGRRVRALRGRAAQRGLVTSAPS